MFRDINAFDTDEIVFFHDKTLHQAESTIGQSRTIVCQEYFFFMRCVSSFV